MFNNNSYPADKCTFELISAYLDGEVTAQQRQEVQQLLATDSEVQQLYRRLLNLREKINDLPTPQPEYSATELSQAVFSRVAREQKQRQKWLWGGGAIAALVVASVSGIFSGGRSPLLQMASQQDSQDTLIIALNEPLIQLTNSTETNEQSLIIPLSESLFDSVNQN